MKNLIFILILLQLTSAHAENAMDIWHQRFSGRVNVVRPILAMQNVKQAGAPPTAECLRRYDRFYSGNTLEITMALGYYDNRPFNGVQDGPQQMELERMLMTGCGPNQYACGFRKVPAPANAFSNSFIKVIKGPDNRPREIHIKIFHASETINDDVNRLSDAQVIRSRLAEDAFKSALRNSDIIFYMGHSRDGGGPDFDPPRLLGNNHVDYPWYHQNRGDFRELLAEIDAASRPPKLLGLLSCLSNMHFAAAIRRTSPTTGLMVSLNEIGDGQMFEGIMTFLNGIQRFKCEAQLSSDLDAVNIDKTKVHNQQKSLLEFRVFPPK